jgi:hypothetical protein
MAEYYGTVEGAARTIVTRCGTKNSGIHTIAASWYGAIETSITWDVDLEVSRFWVYEIPWHGVGREQMLLKGVLGE